ncbi:vWA domain-containing protein [Aliivibrio fischeri]|uniref:vWA domain-containing protein n=1 Tax=Aliivibrio fischeri TaxID=668 RepID=UPI0012DA69FC|nr:VWA domain-containing protein [Aliivibrio fischeri]MUJ26250.1 VWA domain-containing protein [Aliivibrio fischeri]
MIEFMWWWAWFLLPIPLVIYFLMPEKEAGEAIHLPRLPDQGEYKQPNKHINIGLLSLAWLLLIAALARPVWYGEPVDIQPEHRDMMLVVDLSGSMAEEDMKTSNGDFVDRLTAVKQVVSDFIDQRKGDRLGLVLFGDHAYLQTPLTFDRNTVREQLDRTVLNLVGQRTAIGEGLGLATKTFIESNAPQRTIILLSDGANTAGVLEPLEAAQLAKDNHAKIYTVGIGAGEMQVRGFFGKQTVNTARDLDEDTLTKIATMTGGQYFRARNADELAEIYQTIDALEPVTQATQTWRPHEEWFRYPLMGYLFVLFIIVGVRKRHG